MILKRVCFPVVFLLIPFLVSGQIYQTDSGNAEFTGHTPLFSFEGSTDSLQGTVNVSDSSVEFKLPLKTLDTGDDKRDQDMREKLEVGKYPYATFKGEITSSLNLTTRVSKK